MLYKKLYKYCLYYYMHCLNVYMQCFDIIIMMSIYKEFKTNSCEDTLTQKQIYAGSY